MQNNWETKNKALGMSPAEFIKKNSGELTDSQVVKKLSEAGFETTQSAVRSKRRRKNIIKSNVTSKPLLKESYENVGDERRINVENSRIQSQDEFVEKYKIDLTEWEVSEFHISYHEVGHTEKATGETPYWQRENGEMEIATLTNIKATLKPRKDMIFAKREVVSLKEDAKKSAPKYAIAKYPKQKDSRLLVVNMPDLHFNSLAWGKETGYGDWDIKISEKTFRDALLHILADVTHQKFERVVFVVGNDLFSADNAEGTTTGGTQVTTDSRYQKAFKNARLMLVWAIDQMRMIAPVEVKIVPGNHDSVTAWQMGDSLECWYHRANGVVIDNAPLDRKYYEYGKVMLAWIHGKEGKRSDYPLLVSTEMREMWGRTKFCEIHTGHNHIAELKEYHGVRVRILPSLVAPDDWHSKETFVGHVQSAEAYIYDREMGMVGMSVYTVPRER